MLVLKFKVLIQQCVCQIVHGVYTTHLVPVISKEFFADEVERYDQESTWAISSSWKTSTLANRCLTTHSLCKLFLSFLYICADLTEFCPPLNSPSNGNISNNNRAYNSVVTFSCKVGFTLQGSNSTRCLSNRTWGAQSSTCSRKLILKKLD